MTPSHKYKTGRRVINWRTLVISTTLLWCAVAGSYADRDELYVKEQDVFMKPVVVVPEPTIEDKIRFYFPRNGNTMIAIAHAESGMKMESKGYNCYYSNGVATTTKIKGGSKACKVADRHLAHSVDCYILQDNQNSTTCLENKNIDEHLKEMAELSKVCGLDCWWAYKNKTYLKYLAQQ